MKTVFYLTLVIWANTGYGVGIGGGTLPLPFDTLDACVTAAEASRGKQYRSTRSDIDWVCTPVVSQGEAAP